MKIRGWEGNWASVDQEEETRRCNECGEEWQDTGDLNCIFCGSDDTEIVEEDSDVARASN